MRFYLKIYELKGVTFGAIRLINFMHHELEEAELTAVLARWNLIKSSAKINSTISGLNWRLSYFAHWDLTSNTSKVSFAIGCHS
jgi:hypothetical protein